MKKRLWVGAAGVRPQTGACLLCCHFWAVCRRVVWGHTSQTVHFRGQRLERVWHRGLVPPHPPPPHNPLNCVRWARECALLYWTMQTGVRLTKRVTLVRQQCTVRL